MGYTIIGKDPITGHPKRLTENDSITIGQIELTSSTPLVIQNGSVEIANLNAEYLNGRTVSDIIHETLADKKVLIVDPRPFTVSTIISNNEFSVSDVFIVNGEDSLTGLKGNRDEGFIIYDTATGEFEPITLIDSNGAVVKDPYNDHLIHGKLKKQRWDDSNVMLQWTNGSAQVFFTGTLTSSIPYVGNYMQAPNGKWYKVLNKHDAGTGSGYFTIATTYDDQTMANNANCTMWSLETFDSVTNQPYPIPAASYTGYFVKRTNFDDLPEDYIKNSDLFTVDLNDDSTDGIIARTPFLVAASFGAIDMQKIQHAVDVENLKGNLVIQSDPSTSGVSITVGNSNDYITMSLVLANSVDTTTFKIGGVQLQTTISTLNQLQDLDPSITGARINSLFEGVDSFTYGHQHVVPVVYGDGQIGDIVCIASGQCMRSVAAPGSNTFKAYGVLVGIDAANGIGLVLTNGSAPIFSGGMFNNGDEVFLSAQNAGKYETSPPLNIPNSHIVKIGYIHNNRLYVEIEYLTQN